MVRISTYLAFGAILYCVGADGLSIKHRLSMSRDSSGHVIFVEGGAEADAFPLVLQHLAGLDKQHLRSTSKSFKDGVDSALRKQQIESLSYANLFKEIHEQNVALLRVRSTKDEDLDVFKVNYFESLIMEFNRRALTLNKQENVEELVAILLFLANLVENEDALLYRRLVEMAPMTEEYVELSNIDEEEEGEGEYAHVDAVNAAEVSESHARSTKENKKYLRGNLHRITFMSLVKLLLEQDGLNFQDTQMEIQEFLIMRIKQAREKFLKALHNIHKKFAESESGIVLIDTPKYYGHFSQIFLEDLQQEADTNSDVKKKQKKVKYPLRVPIMFSPQLISSWISGVDIVLEEKYTSDKNWRLNLKSFMDDLSDDPKNLLLRSFSKLLNGSLGLDDVHIIEETRSNYTMMRTSIGEGDEESSRIAHLKGLRESYDALHLSSKNISAVNHDSTYKTWKEIAKTAHEDHLKQRAEKLEEMKRHVTASLAGPMRISRVATTQQLPRRDSNDDPTGSETPVPLMPGRMRRQVSCIR